MHRKHALCALMLTAAAGVLVAGPLTPPAGPVSSSYKTLADIEPRTALSSASTPGDATAVYIISQPGSYYLTSPITVPSGKSGVRIAAPNVTLDLGGFSITGLAGSVDGIITTGVAEHIRVHDGAVVSMGQQGVDMSYLSNNSLSNVTVSSCASHGIEMASDSVIEACTVASCGRGIYTGFSTTLRDCVVRNCGDIGILVQQGSVLENCVSNFNAGAGFWVLSGSLLRGCSASTNLTNGFFLADTSAALDCISYANQGDGFNAGPFCRFEGCTANDNSVDGFEVGNQSIVGRCTAASNSAAGILLTSNSAMAEDNSCTGNGLFGIRTTASGALVVRNSVAGNVAGTVNYSFAAGTRYGAIVNAASAGASLSVAPGAAAPASFSTTDPNANLSY